MCRAVVYGGCKESDKTVTKEHMLGATRGATAAANSSREQVWLLGHSQANRGTDVSIGVVRWKQNSTVMLKVLNGPAAGDGNTQQDP